MEKNKTKNKYKQERIQKLSLKSKSISTLIKANSDTMKVEFIQAEKLLKTILSQEGRLERLINNYKYKNCFIII